MPARATTSWTAGRLDGGPGNDPDCLGSEGVDDAPADVDVIRNCE